MREGRRIKISKPQLEVLLSRKPRTLDMAGQGSGKTFNIGFDTFEKVRVLPKAKGFIGANTYNQLSQSTLNRAFQVWKDIGGWTEWSRDNPEGIYVIDKKPPSHFIKYEKFKSYQNIISFSNGAIIFIGSLDNWKAHDGKEFAWAHLDETKDTRQEALKEVIFARLRQFGMWYDDTKPNKPLLFDDKIDHDEAREKGLVPFNPCIIHTSPSLGGVDWVLEMFGIMEQEKQIREALSDEYNFYTFENDNFKTIIYQTYWNENNLPDNYIENRRAELSENEQLLLIEGYPFSKTGGEFYSGFSRRIHVVPNIPINHSQSFHLSFDFNVVPYTSMLIAQVDYITKYINENTQEKQDFPSEHTTPIEVMRIKICRESALKPPNNETEQQCEEFIEFGKINGLEGSDVLVYGDASGKNRIPGLGSLTMFKIIRRTLGTFYNYNERVGKKNVGILSRRKLLNRIFEGKIPEVEIYIDASCKLLIMDLEFLKQSPDGKKYKEAETDKATGKSYEKYGHMSDCLDYFVSELLKHYLKDIN